MRKALCDSFNTSQVILELKTLVSASNSYYAEKQKRKGERVNTGVISMVAEYVTKMMRVFGVFAVTSDPIGMNLDALCFYF